MEVLSRVHLSWYLPFLHLYISCSKFSGLPYIRTVQLFPGVGCILEGEESLVYCVRACAFVCVRLFVCVCARVEIRLSGYGAIRSVPVGVAKLKILSSTQNNLLM